MKTGMIGFIQIDAPSKPNKKEAPSAAYNDSFWVCLKLRSVGISPEKHATIDARQLINDLYLKLQ
jgi:hypothetical protein